MVLVAERLFHQWRHTKVSERALPCWVCLVGFGLLYFRQFAQFWDKNGQIPVLLRMGPARRRQFSWRLVLRLTQEDG